jgi:hypothetical protein
VTESLEDPRKIELREQLSAALDGAGFDVDETRAPVPYPEGTNLKGPGIKADVSCADSNGTRHLYFLRLHPSKPLPGWLINIVTASYGLAQVEVHVAVTAESAQIRASCSTVGVGLVRVRDDNTIETVLAYTTPSQTSAKKELLAAVKVARRRLETKVELNLGRLQTRFDEIASVTAGMPTAMKNKYRLGIEEESLGWQEWLADMSERLDALSTSGDSRALAELEAEIEAKEIP